MKTIFELKGFTGSYYDAFEWSIAFFDGLPSKEQLLPFLDDVGGVEELLSNGEVLTEDGSSTIFLVEHPLNPVGCSEVKIANSVWYKPATI